MSLSVSHAHKLRCLNDLLDETFSCAEEDGATSALDTFKGYVEGMLPPDVLELLYKEAHANLEDIWLERYAPPVEAAAKSVDTPEKSQQSTAEEDGCCVMCNREMKLSRHHTIPREMHERVAKKFGTPKEILNQTILLCRMCHSTVHRFFTNKELAFEFNTLDLLMEDERIQKYAKWASGMTARGNLRVHR